MTKFDPSIEYCLDPTAAAQEGALIYRAARRAVAKFKLNGVERDELLTVLGLKGATERLVASNRAVRLRSTETLVDVLERLVRQGASTPARRYWHVSFLGPLINEYRPEIDMDAYRKVIDRLLRPYPLNALLSIELQALTNYPQQGCGRSFLLNAHAIVWTDDDTFDEEAAADAMCASTALRSEFNARTVEFTARANTDEVPYLGHYLSKLPLIGKRRRKDPSTGAWGLHPVKEVRDDLQLRLLEMLSSYDVTDLVWGVRDGKKLRRPWKAAMVAWNRQRCGRIESPLDKDFDVGALWRQVRDKPRNGSRRYRQPVLYGPRPRPVPSEPWPRQGGKRIWPDRYKVRFEDPIDAIGASDLDDPAGKPALTWDNEDDPGIGSAIERMKRFAAKRRRGAL